MTSEYEMQFPFTTRKEILDWKDRYIDGQTEKPQRQEQAVIDLKDKFLFFLLITPIGVCGYARSPEIICFRGSKRERLIVKFSFASAIRSFYAK